MSRSVYVIGRVADDGFLGPSKIGVAADPAARARDLQTAAPFAIGLFQSWRPNLDDRDIFRLERDLHQILESHRLKGEWFELAPEVAAQHVELTLACIAVACGVPPADAPDFAKSLRSRGKN